MRRGEERRVSPMNFGSMTYLKEVTAPLASMFPSMTLECLYLADCEVMVLGILLLCNLSLLYGVSIREFFFTSGLCKKS
jgi:hypothetical protein